MPNIYEIIYKPWVNNNEGKPWIYSGSNYTDNEKYLGSVGSTQKYDWTENLSLAEWWKKETTLHPERFEKILLVECSNNISRIELQSLESAIQTCEDHRLDARYFNKTNKHFNSPISSSPLYGLTYEEIYGEERANEIKQKRSNKMKKTRTKKFWRGGGNIGDHLRGKTYEEVYGKERTKEIKNKRKMKAKEVGFSGEYSNKKALENGNHISQQPKIKCEYCGKLADKANFGRWHGNKCRSKK